MKKEIIEKICQSLDIDLHKEEPEILELISNRWKEIPGDLQKEYISACGWRKRNNSIYKDVLHKNYIFISDEVTIDIPSSYNEEEIIGEAYGFCKIRLTHGKLIAHDRCMVEATGGKPYLG